MHPDLPAALILLIGVFAVLLAMFVLPDLYVRLRDRRDREAWRARHRRSRRP